MPEIFRRFFRSSPSPDNSSPKETAPKKQVYDNIGASCEDDMSDTVEERTNDLLFPSSNHCDSENDDDSVAAYGGDVSSVYEEDR